MSHIEAEEMSEREKDLRRREDAAGIRPLPWWAWENPSLENDPYHQGYFARVDQQELDLNQHAEWLEGWRDCDNEVREGILCLEDTP